MVETKGRRLGGFLLTRLLGQGAMGAVYQGKQLSLDRDVAVKVILPTYADNPDYIRRFEREAKLIAQLTHQNITQIYEFGTFDGYYLIVMEFVEGTSLKGLLANEKKLPAYAVCEMMAQIANGLSAGASKSIVHRDIKPENIQISKAGICKILDFGLAKDESGNAQMTMAGGILGTPSFMSPEQCQGKTVDYRADTYGLGTSAYYLLTGEVPYKADSQLAVLNMHCNAPIPDPRVIRPDIPEDLALYVMKLMSKKPEDRCKNAGQVVRDLENILHKMTDRKPLDELALEWDWGKMIVLPTTDGTSLLDNLGSKDKNQDRTIVSGTIGGKTAQQSAFNQETIVTGSSTSLQTRGETIGQTQQYSNTQQYGQTMLPGSVSNRTNMDATLLPGGGMTQTMEGTQSSTIIDQNKSKNLMMMVVLVVVVVAIALYFGLKSDKKDWADLDKQFATVREQINQDNFVGLDLAKTMLEKNADYPKKSFVVEEIKTWEKSKVAYDAYKKILNATAEGNYKKAESLADEFNKNYSDSKYLTEILKEKKNWKDYAIASEKLEKALNLAKVFNYDGALDILYEIDYLYPSFDPKKIKDYIRDNEYNNRNKKKGNLKESVDRVKILVKSKDMSQASILIKEIMLKGNEEEKASIKTELDQTINIFKSIVDKRLAEKILVLDAEEIKFIQSVAAKTQEEWLKGFQKKADELVAEYVALKKAAKDLLGQKKFDEGLINIENARKIQKPAEDEAEYLDFLVLAHKGKGDEYFSNSNFKEAYNSYKLGLKTRPDEADLLKKLAETNKKLNESLKSAEADKDFNDAVKKGDTHFENKNYQDASLNYKSALALRPNDKDIEEKVRASSFYADTKLLEKLVVSKEDNTELTQKTLSDLLKVAASENEKKILAELNLKIVDKKCGFLKSSIEKAISQNSFQEASSYLKEYKAIQIADNADLKKTIELFKIEALKSSDEQAKGSLYTKAYQTLELVNELTPDPRVQEKMAKIKKSRDEEKARVENAEKLNGLISEATVAYEKKQFARALEIIQKANDIDSKNIDVIRILKNAGFQNYSALGTKANEDANFEDAIKNYKKALEFDPDRPATKAILEKLERPKAEVVLIDSISKASLQQRAWAASLGLPVIKKVTISGVDFEFALIPPGLFKMGTDEGGDGDELPVREVTISKPFYMLKNEVTNEQYKAFNASEISYSNDPKEPILGIVYTKALGFCKFLETDPGITASVRIPTEAEWEYACRSGSKGDFCFGNKLPELNDYGYFKDNCSGIRKVMQLKPNAFGLHDMHGNAYEWCRDYYEKKAYSVTKAIDPYYGEESDQRNKTKVIRGGDFTSTPANLRSANRNSLAYAQRELLKTVGFRVIIEINPK
jgi:serine/threonine protein kinase/formylglycine-generating enzyme required for sulfatase activity